MESEIGVSSQDITDNQLPYLECERLWHRLKDVQAELQLQIQKKPFSEETEETETETPQQPQSQPQIQQGQRQNQTYEMLQEYEKRLRAELIFLQEKSSEKVLSENTEMLYTILQQGQTQRKQHLSETLSYVNAKHSSLIDSIKQEEALNKTLKRVQEALKAKDAAISMADSVSGEVDSSSGAAITDLKAKMKEVKEANKHFQNEMKELLLAFPSPTRNEQQRKSSKNALDNTRDFDEDNFINLSSIIGQLIEQALNSPGQPYIDISDRMWQQHIEFLLRSQIILKDPESSTRIKLVPFHL